MEGERRQTVRKISRYSVGGRSSTEMEVEEREG
jgi:hypothetical protein